MFVSGLCQGKVVKTGGRLHPGASRERLLEQRPLAGQDRSRRGDCDCLRFSGQLRPSRPLPRAHMSAAAFAYMQQQAAAWVSGLCQGKGDRTGGRLHPGQATAETTPTRHDEGAECGVFLVPVRLAPGGGLRATLPFAFGCHGGKLTD